MENLCNKHQSAFLNEELEQDEAFEDTRQVQSHTIDGQAWWISARWGWHSFNCRENSERNIFPEKECIGFYNSKLVRKIVPAPVSDQHS